MVGRSTIGVDAGSYTPLLSSANMPLFLTRLACFNRSMLDRLLGDVSDGDGERSDMFSSKREGERVSRDDQNTRGETLSVRGDEFSTYGEDSRETIIFCKQSGQRHFSLCRDHHALKTPI